MKRTYTVVGFLGREHGLQGLYNLINSNAYQPVCIFTHKLKPKSEDIDRNLREEFKDYENVCKKNNIPLYTIDKKDEAINIDNVLNHIEDFDFIVSISWRRLIPSNHLNMAKTGGVNLHRGLLPDYPGAEPIKQALKNGDNFIYITSHVLEDTIDSGEIISYYKHPVNYNKAYSLEENIKRLKKEITTQFGPLLIKSLNSMVDKYAKR